MTLPSLRQTNPIPKFLDFGKHFPCFPYVTIVRFVNLGGLALGWQREANGKVANTSRK